MDIYRDILLILEMNKGPMKPTKLMYASNLSWKPMVKTIHMMAKSQLLKIVDPKEVLRSQVYPRSKMKADGRSTALIEMTLKGRYALRLLDEVIKFVKSDDEPMINPPVWLLRKVFEMKGYSLEAPKTGTQFALEAPSIFDEPLKPIASLLRFDGKVNLKASINVVPIISQDLIAMVVLNSRGRTVYQPAVHPVPNSWRQRILEMGKTELKCTFSVKQIETLTLLSPSLKGWPKCLVCGDEKPSKKGLKIHTTKNHKMSDARRREIFELIDKYYADW